MTNDGQPPAERGEARPTFEEQGLQDLRNLIRAFEPEHSSRVPKASETLAKIRALQAALAAPAAQPETPEERKCSYVVTAGGKCSRSCTLRRERPHRKIGGAHE